MRISWLAPLRQHGLKNPGAYLVSCIDESEHSHPGAGWQQPVARVGRLRWCAICIRVRIGSAIDSAQRQIKA